MNLLAFYFSVFITTGMSGMLVCAMRHGVIISKLRGDWPRKIEKNYNRFENWDKRGRETMTNEIKSKKNFP